MSVNMMAANCLDWRISVWIEELNLKIFPDQKEKTLVNVLTEKCQYPYSN